ncbi:hypothetical protein MMC31_005540 [Peltigera leucophlebia]|nr:hypothetical protein [Peltigera leucophlebia]
MSNPSKQIRQMGMISWRYIWYGEHGLTDELYIHCWGQAGYLEMQNGLMAIRDLVVSLEARLKLSDEHGRQVSLSHTEQQEWNHILENLEIKPHESATRPRFLERIGFALVTMPNYNRNLTT